MITPAATDASSTYYKIGATVTLSWNYTSVLVTPTAVVVQAYCNTNKYSPIPRCPLPVAHCPLPVARCTLNVVVVRCCACFTLLFMS